MRCATMLVMMQGRICPCSGNDALLHSLHSDRGQGVLCLAPLYQDRGADHLQGGHEYLSTSTKYSVRGRSFFWS